MTLTFCAVPMMAQWQMQPTPNDTLQPVRNLGNGNVAFSIYAPNAKQVGFGGDAMPWGKPLQFTKADNGVWTAVVSDLKDGVYRYNFTVDGVKVQDPKGALSAETSALANIGDGKQFYDMRADIPHGAIAQRYYYSKVLKTLRRLHVWTPAGYEKSADKLPVLYLIHGGGDNDASWPGVGCAGNILDNLMAEGKMKPMVVVMPNGSIPVKNMMDEVPLFEQDLVGSIIPYIEDNYRVVLIFDVGCVEKFKCGKTILIGDILRITLCKYKLTHIFLDTVSSLIKALAITFELLLLGREPSSTQHPEICKLIVVVKNGLHRFHTTHRQTSHRTMGLISNYTIVIFDKP